MNRKTLAMLIFMLLGFVFIYIAVNVSSLGFLATIGAWILVGLLYMTIVAHKGNGNKNILNAETLSLFPFFVVYLTLTLSKIMKKWGFAGDISTFCRDYLIPATFMLLLG